MYEYDPGLYTLIVGGKTMVGFHSGTFIKAARNNPTWKHEKGAQGSGVRTRSRDKSGYIELTVQSTSPSNSDLREFCKDDEDPNTSPDTLGVLLKYGGPNDDGHVVISAEDAWVEMPADLEAADEHTPRTWKICLDELVWTND
jgi:hypothetical protein